MMGLSARLECRDCSTLIHAFDDFCPVCRLRGPLRVPCSSAIIVAAMSVVAIMLIRHGVI